VEVKRFGTKAVDTNLMQLQEILPGCERGDRFVNIATHGLRRYDVMPPEPVRIFELPGTYTYKTIEQPICDRLGWTKDKIENAACDAYTGPPSDRSYHEIKWNGSDRIYINHISMQQLLITHNNPNSRIAVYFSKYKRVFVYRGMDVNLSLRWYRNSTKNEWGAVSLGYQYFRKYEPPVHVQTKRERREILNENSRKEAAKKPFEVQMQESRERRESREAIQADEVAQEAAEEADRRKAAEERNELIRGALKSKKDIKSQPILTPRMNALIQHQRELDAIDRTMRHWKKMKVETPEEALELTQPEIELGPEAQEVFQAKYNEYFRF